MQRADGCLGSLLEPIGKHRLQQVPPSQGKRDKKRKRRRAQSVQPIVKQDHSGQDHTAQSDQADNALNLLKAHITIGFNATTRHLEQMTQGKGYSSSRRVEPLAAVFVPVHGRQEIMHAHFPSLCKSASERHPESSEIRLIALPEGADLRLATALGIHRVGPIGVGENLSTSRALIEYIQEHVPSIAGRRSSTSRGPYLPTQIKSSSPSGPQRKPSAEEARMMAAGD